MIDDLLLKDFIEIFSGNRHAFGQHIYGKITPGKKEEGGGNRTISDELLRDDNYRDHLEGKKGLGIVPINEENKVKFVVIDIDIYKKGNEQIVINAIEKNELPLAVFKSKSGGYHVYMFFREFVDAKKGTELARKFVRLLAINKLCTKDREAVEIFPKQTRLKNKGSWINLPYYGGDKSAQQMIYEGKHLQFKEAVLTIRNKFYRTFEYLEKLYNDLEYHDAPPCLQSLYYLNYLDSYRNNFLFNFGVYLKKKNETNFETELFRVNAELKSPLPVRELDGTVLVSIRKLGYGYKCQEEPICEFCDKTECQKHEYGVGDGGHVSNLEFGQLYQIKCQEPYYEWEINGKRIRFADSNEILNQHIFRKKCFDDLHYIPFNLKPPTWFALVNEHLHEVKVEDVDIEDDVSPAAIFRNFFCEFVLDRSFASTKEEVLMGKVFEDKENTRYLFRLVDLINYLVNVRNFRIINQKSIHGYLKDIECGETRIRTKQGKNVRLRSIGHEFFKNRSAVKTDAPIEVNFDAAAIKRQVDAINKPQPQAQPEREFIPEDPPF